MKLGKRNGCSKKEDKLGEATGHFRVLCARVYTFRMKLTCRPSSQHNDISCKQPSSVPAKAPSTSSVYSGLFSREKFTTNR